MPLPSDKFKRSSNGGIPVVATVQTPRTTGATSLAVDTQQFWPTSSGIAFSTYKLDANNKKIPGTQTDWEGVSDGTSTLSSIVRTGGAADGGNAINDKVQMVITAQWGEDLIDGILIGHNQDGSHKALVAPSAAIAGNESVGGNLDVAGTVTVGGRDVSELVPSGVTTMFAGPTAPTGWKLCDGTAISRTTFAALFAIIGTTYGTGDGSTTFNLPNFKGKAPFGTDAAQGEFAALGATGGQKSVQSHSHGVNDPGHRHLLWSVGQESNSYPLSGPSTRVVLIGGNPDAGNGVTGLSGTGVSIQAAGAGGNNLNPYLTINFIIKT